MIRKTIFTLFFIITFFHSKSQNPDSLYHETFYGDPQDKIENLYILATIYKDQNLDSCISVLKTAYDLSLEEGREKWLPDIYQLMGVYYSQVGNYVFALKYSNYALNNKKELGYELEEIGEIYNNIGSIYLKKGEYELAIENYHQALDLWKSENSVREGSAYVNLGNSYVNLNKVKKAESYFIEAEKFFEKVGNEKELANTYNHLGRLNQNRGDYEIANVFFKDAIKINLKINHKPGIAIGYNNLAILYYFQEKKDLAFSYFKKGLDIRKQIGNYIQISESYYNLGALYQFESNFKEAIRYFKQSLKYAQLGQSIKDLEDVSFALSENYNALNKKDSAYVYLKKCINFKDSLSEKRYRALKREVEYNNLKSQDELNGISENYQIEKSSLSREIDENNKKFENTTYTLSLVIILIFGLAVVISLLYFNTKKNNRLINKKLKEQTSELDKTTTKYTQAIQILKYDISITNSESFFNYSNNLFNDGFCIAKDSQQADFLNHLLVQNEDNEYVFIYKFINQEDNNFILEHLMKSLLQKQILSKSYAQENLYSKVLNNINQFLVNSNFNENDFSLVIIHKNVENEKKLISSQFNTLMTKKIKSKQEIIDKNSSTEIDINNFAYLFIWNDAFQNLIELKNIDLEETIHKVFEKTQSYSKEAQIKIMEDALKGAVGEIKDRKVFLSVFQGK